MRLVTNQLNRYIFISSSLLTNITDIKINHLVSPLSISIPSIILLLFFFFGSDVKWKCSHLPLTKCNGMCSEWKGREEDTKLLLLLLHQTLPANTHAVVTVALTCLHCCVFAEFLHQPLFVCAFFGRLLC